MLRVVGWNLCSFYSIFDRTFCKQTEDTLTRRRVLWLLIWVCTVCCLFMSHKRTLGISRRYWVRWVTVNNMIYWPILPLESVVVKHIYHLARFGDSDMKISFLLWCSKLRPLNQKRNKCRCTIHRKNTEYM